MPSHHTLYRTAVAVAIACHAQSGIAQGPLVLVPVRVSQVMSEAEQQRTGVARLTREQRIALDGWLTRYSAELRRAAGPPSAQPSQAPATSSAPAADSAIDEPASDEVSGADAEPVTQPAHWPRRWPWLLPFIVPPGAPLVATPEDGAYVRLADGTLWEVYLPDRTATDVWRAGDYIAVSRAAVRVGDYYDHVLVNAPARTQAAARFAGLVSPRRR